MPKLDELLQQIITSTDGVLGITVIEMSSRKIISSSQQKTELSPAILEAIAVSAVEMMRGKAISAIESLLSKNLKEPAEDKINELYFNTKNSRFLFSTINENPGILIALSTDKSVTVGMGWLLIRENMGTISENLP